MQAHSPIERINNDGSRFQQLFGNDDLTVRPVQPRNFDVIGPRVRPVDVSRDPVDGDTVRPINFTVDYDFLTC